MKRPWTVSKVEIDEHGVHHYTASVLEIACWIGIALLPICGLIDYLMGVK